MKRIVFATAVVVAFAMFAPVSMAHPAHADPAQGGPHFAFAGVDCRTVAQEKAFLTSAGASNMAKHVKSVTCSSSSGPKPTTVWSLQSTTTSWGGYISDTTGQTNTNAAMGEFTLSNSGSDTYDTSEWVGIGGFAHNTGGVTLLQGGVELQYREMWWQAINSNGTVWAGAYDYTDIGAVGDLYSTLVTRTGVGVWDVTVEDLTKGKVFTSNDLGFSPDHTSAEWVMEYEDFGHHAVESFSPSVPFTDLWFDDINYNQHNVAYANTYWKSELHSSSQADCIKPGTLTNDTPTYSHFTDTYATTGC